MADDDWSFLDEELDRLESRAREKKASGGGRPRKGPRVKPDDAFFSSAQDETPVVAPEEDGGAVSSSPASAPIDRGVHRGGPPSPRRSAARPDRVDPGGPARSAGSATTQASSDVGGQPLDDEWAALDEELERALGKNASKEGWDGSSSNKGERRRGREPKAADRLIVARSTAVSTGFEPTPPRIAPEAHQPSTLRAPPGVGRGDDGDAAVREAKLTARAARFADTPGGSKTPPPPPPPPPSSRGERVSAEDDAVSAARHVVGTCELMCPVGERADRERTRELDAFERVEPSDPGSTSDASLAVKKFVRVVDDPSPDSVRTIGALEKTAAHLYSLLGGRADYPADSGEPPLVARANFLWDRLRAVRQDISLQAIVSAWSVARLEEMCRFAVAAEYLLCEEAITVENPGGGHNSHLHVEQLAKTITSLRHMYDDLREPPGTEGGDGESNPLQFPHEPEMVSYQLLLRLDNHGPFRKSEGGEFLRDLRGLPRAVLESPHVALALEARRLYVSGNAPGFFRLVKSKRCSYLQACCLHKYFAKMRSSALEVVNATHNKTRLAMDAVGREILGGCDAQATETLARRCGLAVVTEDAGEGGERKSFLAVKEATFHSPTTECAALRTALVDNKAPSTKGGFFRWEALITGKVGS